MSAYNEYQIERGGFVFRVEYHYDEFNGKPWEESDGHGPVSDWERRDKKPGELILSKDHGSKLFYDFQEACRIALRDGWGCPPYDVEGETNRQKAARAARADFEYLRGWCHDEWHWAGIVVKMLDDEGEETGEEESVWGYASCDGAFMRSEAENTADSLAAGVVQTQRFMRQGAAMRDALIDARGV